MSLEHRHAPRIVEHQQTGLVPALTVQDPAAAWLRMVCRKEERQQFSSAALSHARAHLTDGIMAGHIEDAYEPWMALR